MIPSRLTLRSKWAILAAVMVGTFSQTLDGGMVSISFPALVTAFDTDASVVVWVTTAFFLASVSVVLTMAWVADTLGRKRVYIGGFALYTLAIVLIPFAPNIGALIVLRILQAVGAAMTMATGMALITAVFPPEQRGRAIGVNIVAVGLGLGLGPAIGGFLLDALDWRALFWTRAPLGLLVLVLSTLVLPADHRTVATAARASERLQVDYWGPVLLAATAVSFLLALNLAGRGGLDQPVVWVLWGASPFLLALLLRVERRAPRPVIDLEMFRNRVFAVALGSQFFHYVATGMAIFLGAFYLLDGLGLSPTRAGLVLTFFPVMRVVGGPIGGWAADHMGTRVVSMVGLAIMGAGFLMLATLDRDAALWAVTAAYALTGLGSAFFEPANESAIMGSASRERLSAASASVAAGRQVSQSVGYVLGGAIFTLSQAILLAQLTAVTSVDRQQAVVDSFGNAMLAAAVLCFIGTAVSWLRGRG